MANQGMSFSQDELAVLHAVMLGLCREADLRVIARHPALEALGERVSGAMERAGIARLPRRRCPLGCRFVGASPAEMRRHFERAHTGRRFRSAWGLSAGDRSGR